MIAFVLIGAVQQVAMEQQGRAGFQLDVHQLQPVEGDLNAFGIGPAVSQAEILRSEKFILDIESELTHIDFLSLERTRADYGVKVIEISTVRICAAEEIIQG